MQIIACDSVTGDITYPVVYSVLSGAIPPPVPTTSTLTCHGQTAIDVSAVTGISTPIDKVQIAESFAGGFVTVATAMLFVFGFKRLYYSIPKR